jgi:hypothetical protein
MQQLRGALLRLAPGKPGDHLRQHDIFERRKFRQQMMELIDEADLAAPQRGALIVGHPDGGFAGDKHFPSVGRLEKARNMEERRFAGTGRGDQRDRLPRPEAKIGAAQNFERRPRLNVAAFDLFEAKRRRRHGYS